VPTAEERAAWERERRLAEEVRAREVEQARKMLDQEHLWQHYHEQITPEARAAYYKRGITDYFIDYVWGLGYCPQKWCKSGETNFTTDTLTIPVFEPITKKILTIEHRLLKPLDPGDKYRPETKGLPSVLFVADYEKPITGKGLMVEGKFKAMTTYLCADDPDLCVIGAPGKSPDLSLLAQMENCDPLIICVDPDAFYVNDTQRKAGQKVSAVQRLCTAFDELNRMRKAESKDIINVRFMQLADKIDDMIMMGAINKQSLHMLMDTARILKPMERL
jgi:hypothetical protein